MGKKRNVLITGYPGFISQKLLEKIIYEEPQTTVYLIVLESLLNRARREISKLKDGKKRVKIFSGDIIKIDLGLSGKECDELLERVTDIYHLAAIYYLGVSKEYMWKVNVTGTENLLQFATEMKRLRVFNHFSTCHVSGTRTGVICEDELDLGQKFRNFYEYTKFEAEKVVHTYGNRVPFIIFRPSIVIGDAKTRELERFRSIYYFAVLLVTSPIAVPLPLPGSGNAPLNVVPINFVVDTVYYISLKNNAIGKTFHIVDPNPPSFRKVYELVAKKSLKPIPHFTMAHKIISLLPNLPLVGSWFKVHKKVIDYIDHNAIYNCVNTLSFLQGSGVEFPRFDRYIDSLVEYVKHYYSSREKSRKKEDEIPDPLM